MALEQCFKKTERSWGFHPRHVGSPQYDNPEKVITTLSHCGGAVRGDRHCPLLNACVHFFVR
jgi:hypothetical protein